MIRDLFSRNPFLPAALLLGMALLLLLIGARVASTLPEPTPLPTIATPTRAPALIPTASFTPTLSPTATRRATWTLRPSGTSTVTGTPEPTGTITPPPTLTPAKAPTNLVPYRLRVWSPTEANQLIDLFQGYPNSRYPDEKDRHTPGYDDAFAYIAIAAQEALLRYPQDPLAARWRWAMAYALARSRSPRAGGEYASLVVEGLNTHQANANTLSDWFSRQEPRMVLQLVQLPAAPGTLSSQIVEIKPAVGGGPAAGNVPSSTGSAPPSTGEVSQPTTGGGAYLWLLQTPNGYQAHVLDSQFDFAHAIQAGVVTGDLNQDGVPEAVIYYSPADGSFPLLLPRVWSLSQVPPSELPFAPSVPFEIGIAYEPGWTVTQAGEGQRRLEFSGKTFPSCPAVIHRSYQWMGERFEPVETRFEIQPVKGLQAFCEYTINHSASFWGPEATAGLMEKLLPDWPPAQTVNGNPYPADAADEWRYRLAIQSAMAGDRARAVGLLDEVIKKPAPSSQWLAPAKDFLAAYQSPADLYRACVQSTICDPRRALETLATSIPSSQLGNAGRYLKGFGVMLRSASSFDFDGDGKPEPWFLIRHREGEKTELWVLADDQDKVKAMFVEIADTSDPKPHYHDPKERPLIVQIRQHEGFILHKLPTTQEPYIEHVDVEFIPTTYTLDTLNAAEKDLFSGKSPAEIAIRLANLYEDSSKFNCINYRFCDRYYYTLGLAYELAGEQKDAIEWYDRLWATYPDSPYTIIGRLRLVRAPTRTPTPSRTPTATNTRNPNETPTRTRIPTSTSEAYPYPYTSPSPEPTNTPYP